MGRIRLGVDVEHDRVAIGAVLAFMWRGARRPASLGILAWSWISGTTYPLPVHILWRRIEVGLLIGVFG